MKKIQLILLMSLGFSLSIHAQEKRQCIKKVFDDLVSINPLNFDTRIGYVDIKKVLVGKYRIEKKLTPDYYDEKKIDTTVTFYTLKSRIDLSKLKGGIYFSNIVYMDILDTNIRLAKNIKIGREKSYIKKIFNMKKFPCDTLLITGDSQMSEIYLYFKNNKIQRIKYNVLE